MKRMIALVLSLVMALSLCAPAWGADPVEVSDEAGLVAAFENGGTYKLTKSVAVAENTRFVVGKGVSVTLDLGGNTLSSTNTATATHNFFIDVKGGTLTISNGAVEYTHTGANMGWNGATEVFDVTAGGVLNMSGVASKISGTDMNFAVHMNNWGEVTLNVQNSYLKATYMPVRVFNSGPDMNNVTIENSTLDGGNHSFWVHNYTSADFGGKLYSAAAAAYDEDAVAARLKFDIYGNGNTFITGKDYPVRYGFNGSTYFTSEGISSDVVAKVGNEYYKTLQEALNVGGTVELLGDIILAAPVTVTKDAVLDLKGFGITSTDTTSGVPIYVSSGKLTVRNGELALDGKETTIHGTYNCAIGYEPGTELVVDDVTFTGVTGINGTWKADGAVKISVSNSTFTVSNAGVVVSAGSKEAVATITNCTIDAGEYAIFGSQGAQITVNGGNYTSNVAIYSQDAGTVVTVEGGTFTGALSEANNGKIVIKGGTFSTDVSAYVAEGYICAFNSDAKAYTVQKKGAAADNGTVKEEVTENLNNAAANDAVVNAVTNDTSGENKVTVVEGTGAAAQTTTIEFNNATDKAAYVSEATNANPDISTEIAISDVSNTLDAAVQNELKDELKDVAGDDARVAAILDIDIHVFVNDQHVGQLTELPQPITITLDLPEIEEELKTGYRRNYFVIIHHDGEAEKIPATVSGDKLVITSDRFSPYALGYVDTEIPAGGYYPYNPAPTTKPVQSAKTFDAGIAMYVGMSVMAACGSAVVIGKKKD